MRKLNRDIFLSGDLTLFFAFFFDFWADSVIKLRHNTTHRCYIPRGVLGTRVNGVGSSDTWSDKVGYVWTGKFDFNTDTCGRRNFWIRKEKFADSKISENLWTGP